MKKYLGLTMPTLLFCYFLLIVPLLVWTIFSIKRTIIELEFFSVGRTMFSLIVILDFTRVSFSIVISIISRIVLIFGDYYIKDDPFYERFFWLVFLFVLSINFLVFIPSLPCLLLGWDGLGITSFILIIYYQNRKSLGAGIHTLLLNRIGDVLILISFGIFLRLGHWNIIAIWSRPVARRVIILITLAAITKRAQVPFSRWLPAAIAAPTPVRALVHSSTLVTAGIFLLIRFSPALLEVRGFQEFLILTAVATSLLGGWGALYENDLKKIIALSTLSQLGVIIFSLSLGFVNLTLFHLYTHALFKSILFVCAGHILHTSWGTQDIRRLGNTILGMPITAFVFNLGNLCLMGIPFISGFYSKDSILEIILSGNFNLMIVVIILFATRLTACYSIRLRIISLWSRRKSVLREGGTPFQIIVPIFVLSGFGILAGKVFSISLISNLEFRFIPIYYKISIIFVVARGIIFALRYSSIETRKSLGIKAWFLRSIWFLPNLVAQPVIYVTIKSSYNITKNLETGWVEPISQSRIFWAFFFIIKKVGLLQESYLTKALNLIFILVIVILGYLIYT